MYLFTYGRVINSKVKLNGTIEDGSRIGLCLKNNIRFYNWDLLGYVNSKKFFEDGGSTHLKRMFNASMDDFIVNNNSLRLRERTSSDITKSYGFYDGVFIVYTDAFFDIIETGKLNSYLKDNCFDVNDEKRILEKKPLVL